MRLIEPLDALLLAGCIFLVGLQLLHVLRSKLFKLVAPELQSLSMFFVALFQLSLQVSDLS